MCLEHQLRSPSSDPDNDLKMLRIFYQCYTISSSNSLFYSSPFQLAKCQTRHVISRLQELYPDRKFEIRKWYSQLIDARLKVEVDNLINHLIAWLPDSI